MNRMIWQRFLATMALVLILGAGSITVASAQPGNSNSKKSTRMVLLNAVPGTYNGPCPGMVVFNALVHGSPGDTVVLEWTNGDSTVTNDTVVLDRTGKAYVSLPLAVDSDDSTETSGETTLSATYSDGSTVTSKAAKYKVKCNPHSNRNHDRDSIDVDDSTDVNDSTDVDDSTAVSVTATPEEYEGPCPTEILFTATINGEPGDTLTVLWNRSDSALGSPVSVVIDSTGTATLTDTWTLGSTGTVEGWESVTVTYPDSSEVTSNQATFMLDCAEPDTARVSVTASLEEYEGPCPTDVLFTATINGTAGDTVSAQWNRSDSATIDPERVVIDSTGVATITMTWSVGDSGVVDGWGSLTVTYPDSSVYTSDQASFMLDCMDSTQTDDSTTTGGGTTESEDGSLRITLHATPGAHVGPCPGDIQFIAMVRGTPGDTVTVTWNRSDGATGTPETVVLDSKGKATVTTSWMLGGDNLLQYQGWESVTVTSSDGTEVTSREAHFRIRCQDHGRVNEGRGPKLPNLD